MEGSRLFSLKKDPLVILGVAVLFAGIVLLAYGFVPLQHANYKVIASQNVPITDTSGNFVTNPENYFRAHYTGPGPVDLVECSPSPSGYECYGLQFTGTTTFFSYSSRYYGAGMIALGIASTYAGNRLAPFAPKSRHVRPITVRIDEGICLSNGVCVELAPNVFQFKKQEAPTIFAPLAFVVDPTGADNDTIIEAAKMCPSNAIIIEDEETGERIHPPLPKG